MFLNFVYNVNDLILAVFTVIPTLVQCCDLVLPDKKNNKKVIKYIRILSVLIVIFMSACAFIKSQITIVPDVVDLPYDLAMQTLKQKNIPFEVDMYVEKNCEYTVVSQSIEAGEFIWTNQNIKLLLKNESIIGNSWSIDILNDIQNSTINIGDNIIIDLAISTPISQGSTPYILYGDYVLPSEYGYRQILSYRISDEISFYRLTINSSLLNLENNDYIFRFAVFAAEDYGEGNSKCETACKINVLNSNNYSYLDEEDIFYNNTVICEALSNITMQNREYPIDIEKISVNNISKEDARTLSYLTNLKELTIYKGDFEDINFLSRLARLESLDVHCDTLSDISAIKNMPYLNFLSIGGENINGIGHHGVLNDISDIKRLKYLNNLYIYDCCVDDISCLNTLQGIEYLNIFKTNVSDISVLSNLTSLKEIKIHANNISDISPIYELPELKRVVISKNNIPKEQIDLFKEKHPDCNVYTGE